MTLCVLHHKCVSVCVWCSSYSSLYLFAGKRRSINHFKITKTGVRVSLELKSEYARVQPAIYTLSAVSNPINKSTSFKGDLEIHYSTADKN